MILQFHPYAVVLFVSAFATLIASIIILRRDVPGSLALGGVLLGAFIWSSAYAICWSLTMLDEKMIWLKIMYLGVVAVPTSFLVFTLRVAHYDNWLTGRTLFWLSVEPLVVLTLVWFQPVLFFAQMSLEQKDGFAVLHLGRGIGFWINT